MVASTPCFLNKPAFSASESGANPVHPLMAMVTLGSWAITGSASARIKARATQDLISMTTLLRAQTAMML